MYSLSQWLDTNNQFTCENLKKSIINVKIYFSKLNNIKYKK